MALKIVIWNVEQLGDTALKRGDKIKHVGRVLEREKADIVAIQELRPSKISASLEVVRALNDELSTAYQFILCPYNGFERYLYFYRKANLEALVLADGGVRDVSDETVSKVPFVAYQGNTITGKKTGLANFFPLFDYPGARNARKPGLGLFRYKENNISYYFCLMTWHNDAKRGYLHKNIGRLDSSKILSDAKLKISVNNSTETVKDVMLGGDFNSSLTKPVNNKPFPHFDRSISELTHLHTYSASRDGETQTTNLRDYLLDNLLTNMENLEVSSAAVLDPLKWFMDNKIVAKDDLINSDFRTQVQALQTCRKRLQDKIPKRTGKGATRNGLTKTDLGRVRKMLSKVNLQKIGKPNLMRQITGLGLKKEREDLVLKAADTFLDKEIDTKNRWDKLVDDISKLMPNDTLVMTRKWLSDHLPVVVTMKV
jgi:hypothetical protein